MPRHSRDQTNAESRDATLTRPTVSFSLAVTLKDEYSSEQEAIDNAVAVLRTAPAFDGLSEQVIADHLAAVDVDD
jgi:hypothetical protein